MNIFDHRDAIADKTDIASQLRYEAGPVVDRPLVTIAIPTFRRATLLLETLMSALDQQTDVAFEVIIVDNDPNPAANLKTIASLPADPIRPLRYFVNAENIGMFPNWNRGIELARGTWVSVLNDDDLLMPGFVAHMIALVRRRSEIDGIVAQTGFLDRRDQAPEQGETRRRSIARSIWRRLVERRYDRDGLTRIGARSLFFGNELSSTLAFLFKRDLALSLGGFRHEDWPSADYLFYARFAVDYALFLTKEELGLVGIGENESMRPEAMLGFMTQGDRLRRSMAGRHVPRRWLDMSPLIVSTAIAETEANWRTALDRAAIAEALGMTLPAPSRSRLNMLRLVHGGL